MERLLHILPVQITIRFVFHAYIYTLRNFLQWRLIMLSGLPVDLVHKKSIGNVAVKTYSRTQDLWLREHWWNANIKSNIILVHKFAGFCINLVHNTRANWRNWVSIIFTHISRVVTSWSKQFICFIWNQSMRPEEQCPWIEVSRIFENRITQLQSERFYISLKKALFFKSLVIFVM